MAADKSFAESTASEANWSLNPREHFVWSESPFIQRTTTAQFFFEQNTYCTIHEKIKYILIQMRRLSQIQSNEISAMLVEPIQRAQSARAT